MHKIQFIDSHTGGEPTRVVLSGGPDLGAGPMADRLHLFSSRFDAFRSAICNEPRGSDAMVGALLCEPCDPSCDVGVIFFNNTGYLGMCGHGTMGLLVTLGYLGRVKPGEIQVETPVGVVRAALLDRHRVQVKNVPSFRTRKEMQVHVPGEGMVIGDIAWGGNWFFLAEAPGLSLDIREAERLSAFSRKVRQAVNEQGAPEVDHVELFGPGRSGGDSRNFVLCPGGAYDRSPCGTGTSAKLSCLASDGLLGEGRVWTQESMLGSRFEASYRWLDREKGIVEPSITGEAFVTAESTAMIDPEDPFGWGFGQ